MTNLAAQKMYSTINFMYFITNYQYGFIHQVWQGTLADHLQSKFLNLCERYGRSDFALVSFFYELGRDNQIKLLDWVDENYVGFRELKELKETIEPSKN
jgi:hypothetical protein